MRVPIRMIGIATTFFWTFLIAFFATAVYSIKDVQFSFGEPQINQNSHGDAVFSLPVSIVNRGLYNIGPFRIFTEVLDVDGSSIVQGATVVPVIKRDDNITVTHNMTLSVDALLNRSDSYLFNDADLKINAAVGMQIAEVIPVEASTNFSMPWGAPLYNFSLGEPSYAPYNATHLRVTVPISFENHAFFDLIGDMRIRMYNSTGARVGRGQMSFEAYSNSPYNGFMEFYVLMSGVTSTGRFEIFFDTEIFDYGSLVIPYG